MLGLCIIGHRWSVYLFLCHLQVASLSSPMQEWRTVPSSSATMASASCVVTHVLRSCRSHAHVTSCTGPTPSGWPSPRWLRPCSGQRRGKWRSTFTTKTVGKKCVWMVWAVLWMSEWFDVEKSLYFGSVDLVNRRSCIFGKRANYMKIGWGNGCCVIKVNNCHFRCCVTVMLSIY